MSQEESRDLFPQYTWPELWETAKGITSRHSNAQGPPVDIEAIIEREGIYLDVLPGLYDALGRGQDGVVAVSDAGDVVIKVDQHRYDSDNCKPRMRFTLAHEFAHYWLHIKPCRDSISIANYLDRLRDRPPPGFDPVERNADLLAGFLLVPEGLFQGEMTVAFDKYYAMIEGHGEGFVLKALSRELMSVFQVSQHCMNVRMKTRATERLLRELIQRFED